LIFEAGIRERRSVFGTLTPLLRSWRLLLGMSVLAGAITFAIIRSVAPSYSAGVTLSTISNPRAPSLAGGLGGLISGSLSSGGPNPALIVRIAGQYGVLYKVAHSSMLNSRETIGSRLRKMQGRDIVDRELVGELKKFTRASYDKGSGVIVLETVAKDSAFARSVTTALLRETGQTFIDISRAQGTELRKAMEGRVESAAQRLAAAEEAQRQFAEANRSVSPFSYASIEQSRLRQAADLARQVYTQATTDREGAIAKELEVTPAVVTIDPVPAEIPPLPRHALLKSLAASLFAFVLLSLLLISRESARRAVAEGDPEAIHFALTVQEMRFAGAMLRWLFPKPPNDRGERAVALADNVSSNFPPKKVVGRSDR
jgi:hypothetical protein